MIQNTIKAINYYKMMNIIDSSQLHICLNSMEQLFDSILKLKNAIDSLSQEEIIGKLQEINNELNDSFRLFGTYNIEDVLFVCFGDNYIKSLNKKENELFKIIKQYTHPLNFKILSWKDKNESKYNKNSEKQNS